MPRRSRKSRQKVGSALTGSERPQAVNTPPPEPTKQPAAEADLHEIWYRVSARRGEDEATRLVEAIVASARRQTLFPQTGRLREDIYPGLRSYFFLTVPEFG